MQKIREKSPVIKSEGFFGLLKGENAGKGGNGIRSGRGALKSPELSFPTKSSVRLRSFF